MTDANPAEANPNGGANALSDRVVLVTGMSGAGRSSALNAFEDMGYEAVDNLPLSLLGRVAQAGRENPRQRPLAIGIDIRTRDFGAEPFAQELDGLQVSGAAEVITLFLDCDDDVLVRRFTETRRRHPLAGDRPIPDVLKLERRMLMPLRDHADMVIDTSLIAPGALKDELRRRFAIDGATGMALLVMSFSYRHGLPREADLVFDARFLVNPYYDPALRDLTGRDATVGRAIEADPDLPAFFEGISAMLSTLLPRYRQEGKSYLTIAIGCTGGRHRSVYVSEKLAERLVVDGWRATINHRDIARRAGQDMH